MFPLLIQILGAVYKEAKLLKLRKNPVLLVAFGTVQIMIGLFIIGLKLVAGNNGLSYQGAVYIIGALYITCGIVPLLLHPSIWWVAFTAFMNLVTVAWTTVGIIFYVVALSSRARVFLNCLDIFSIVLTVVQMCICISLAVICIRDMIRREKEEQFEEDSEAPKEAMISPLLN